MRWSMSIKRRAFEFAICWLIDIAIFTAILTSCADPYQAPPAGTRAVTATAVPTATAPSLYDGELELLVTHSPTCIVNAGAVYLRSGAGMSFDAIRVLHAGDVLNVIEPGTWLKVKTAQRVIGWVYGRYCE
jgi:hypothetical protein